MLDPERPSCEILRFELKLAPHSILRAITFTQLKNCSTQLMVQDFWENSVVEPKLALLIDGHPEVNYMLLAEQLAAALPIKSKVKARCFTLPFSKQEKCRQAKAKGSWSTSLDRDPFPLFPPFVGLSAYVLACHPCN